ncbi:MAG: segregation/condensation protein A [bacterium]
MLNLMIKTPVFEGTLDELISGIRRHEIEIFDVALSDVTTQTRELVIADEQNTDFEPFMKISGLMFIKSRAALPTGELSMEDELLAEAETLEEIAEEEPTRIRERLEEQYRLFKELGDYIRDLVDERSQKLHFSLTREGQMNLLDEISYLEEVTAYDLLIAYTQACRRALEDRSMHVSTDEAQTLARRITEVFDFIFKRGETTPMSTMLAEVKAKTDVILTFLAIIFLVASGKISAQQKAPFSEILLAPVQKE